MAIEAIKERFTISELVAEYQVHANMIQKWKQEFLSRSPEIFSTKSPQHNFEVEREKLFAKIGELEMEKDWLKKKSWRGLA